MTAPRGTSRRTSSLLLSALRPATRQSIEWVISPSGADADQFEWRRQGVSTTPVDLKKDMSFSVSSDWTSTEIEFRAWTEPLTPGTYTFNATVLWRLKETSEVPDPSCPPPVVPPRGADGVEHGDHHRPL